MEIRTALIVVLLAGVLWVLFSPWLAERLLFFPDRRDPGPAPVLAGISGTDVVLTTPDGVRIHGWWHPVGPEAPAVLLLHGNAGNIAGRTPLAAAYLARGISIFMLDYRGYGRSEGRPTEAGLYRDAGAALDFLELEVGSGRVVLHGRSLGGAIAARAALDREVAGVIVEASFTSLSEMARVVYPFLPAFAVSPLSGRFDVRAALSELSVPLLVAHGTQDEIVPVAMGRALHEAAPGPRQWFPIEGAGHNDTFLVGGEGYFARLAAFVLESVAPR